MNVKIMRIEIIHVTDLCPYYFSARISYPTLDAFSCITGSDFIYMELRILIYTFLHELIRINRAQVAIFSS